MIKKKVTIWRTKTVTMYCLSAQLYICITQYANLGNMHEKCTIPHHIPPITREQLSYEYFCLIFSQLYCIVISKISWHWYHFVIIIKTWKVCIFWFRFFTRIGELFWFFLSEFRGKVYYQEYEGKKHRTYV